MSSTAAFPPATVEALARVLGEAGSGSDISRYLTVCHLTDNSGESTKWRRLNAIFLESQATTDSPNQILAFIKTYMAPSRFAGRSADFDQIRQDLNTVLVLEGLEFGNDGELRRVDRALNLDEAERRAQAVRSKLHGRAVHGEVHKYCTAELMQENYFHAVFEACKGLAHRIREMSGAGGDGAPLVDRVFAIERPILAFNTLETDTERSEHKGFAALLKGCFAAIRNPLAHEPKILWEGEDDAADYFTLISLLHRKLDRCVATGVRP